MKILAIESSAVSASAAVVEDKKILGEFYLNIGLTHSQTLMPMIASVLECSCTSLEDIDVLAVTNGPGSFTGVRIGVATVKGLAAPTDKRCIGVSTLLSMAYNLADRECIICGVMDARREQVYTAIFRASGGVITRITEDEAVSIESLGHLLSEYGEKVVFVGDGAQLCYNKLSHVLPDALIAPENIRYQRASGVASAVLGYRLFNNTVSADELTVNYLRLSQAERELKARSESK